MTTIYTTPGDLPASSEPPPLLTVPHGWTALRIERTYHAADGARIRVALDDLENDVRWTATNLSTGGAVGGIAHTQADAMADVALAVARMGVRL